MRNLPTEQREKLLALIEEENADEAQTISLTYEVSDDIKAIISAESGDTDGATEETTDTAFTPVID